MQKYHSIRGNKWCYHTLFIQICLMARLERERERPIQHKDHSSVWQQEISTNPKGLRHIMFFQFQTLSTTTRTSNASPTTRSTWTQTKTSPHSVLRLSAVEYEMDVLGRNTPWVIIWCWRRRISSQCIYILMFYLLYEGCSSQGHSHPMSLLFDKKYK